MSQPIDYYAISLGTCREGTKVYALMVPITLAWFIATVLLALRIYTRFFVVKKAYGWDDLMMVIAWMLATVPQGFAFAAATYGFGKHLSCLNLGQAFDILKLQYIGEVPGFLCMLFARLSICIFLLRLFTTNKSWRITIYVIIGLNIFVNLASAVVPLLRCRPTSKAWIIVEEGYCWDATYQQNESIAQGALSALMDLALAFLPIYFMAKVQVSFAKKVMICGLMSLGFFTALCAILRSVYIPTASSPDATYDAIPIIVFALLECHIAIIVGCLPAIPPFFTMKGWKPSASRGSSRRPIVWEERQNHAPRVGGHEPIAYPGSPWSGQSEKQSGTSKSHTHSTSVGPDSIYESRTGLGVVSQEGPLRSIGVAVSHEV